MNIKVKIICPLHGIFEQTPISHRINGCSECSGNKKMNNNTFIEKSKNIQKNIFDYSLVEYKNNRTKVKIICKKHGIFEQSPEKHLIGQGCPTCAKEKRQN